MFELLPTFFQGLQNWVQEQNQEPYFKQLYQYSAKHQKIPLLLLKVWRFYLLQFFLQKKEFITLSQSVLNLFDRTAFELANCQDFITQKEVLKIIDPLLLCCSQQSDREELIQCIFQLHQKRNLWSSGEYHQLLQNDLLSGLKKIQYDFRFTSMWDTAAFIKQCGYSCVASKSLFLTWCRFAQHSEDEIEYSKWVYEVNELLKEDSDYWDFVFDEILFPAKKSKLSLCEENPNCSICPIQKNCLFFSINREEKKIKTIQNQLLAGDFDSIQDQPLILFLAGERWNQSKNQSKIIQFFLSDKNQRFSSFPVPENEESFSAFLLGLNELNRRRDAQPTLNYGESFQGSQSVYEHLRLKIGDSAQESFYIFILDHKNRNLQLQLVSKGTISQSLVHPREVFSPAIQLRASSVILVHNHPSGSVTPSKQDYEVTKRLFNAGKILGIQVLDHIIIGRNCYYSFVDEGDLPL
ncbi:MAG: hypothetical protein ACI86H_002528 [bacterium]|jgi:hypothetical protein